MLTYTQCIEKFGSKYNLKKAINAGTVYQIEKGIYSEKKYISALEIISFKYPNAILTMNSAFYYHSLSDVIPEKFYLMTGRGAAKIPDNRVVQIFENSDVLELGADYMEHDGIKIHMYNRERMLVELLRNKNKLTFDYYKEVLGNYRKIADQLNIPEIEDYAYVMPKSRMIMEALQMEVF